MAPSCAGRTQNKRWPIKASIDIESPDGVDEFLFFFLFTFESGNHSHDHIARPLATTQSNVGHA
jgi:hypothetical protein